MVHFTNDRMFNHRLIDAFNEHQDSSYKILVFDWWTWLRSQANALDTKLSTDEVITEVKEYDICFFVIREVLKTTGPNNYHGIDKILQNMVTELDNLNVFYVTLSENSIFPMDESKTFSIPWFIGNDLYTSPDTSIDFDYRPKDYTFNMLLGSEKPHRTRMFETIGAKSYMYSTYFGHKDFKHKSSIHLEDIDITNNLTNQDENVKLDTENIHIIRDNSNWSLSHIVPESIYNNSHFDMVAETHAFPPNMDFTTEKTGKPLSTGRFFIWYNSPHKVEYLKQFGFELQDYLCEYDNILDDDDRLTAILDLIKDISDNENYIKKIYKDTKKSRIHNQELYKELMETTDIKLSSWITTQINRNYKTEKTI